MPVPTRLYFRHLHLAFQKRVIFDGLSLSLHAGHCTLLCGNNGAGKSTLLRIIAGLQRPDYSCIDLGTDSGSDPDTTCVNWRRARRSLLHQVVYLHQSPYMFDRSVAGNLAYALPRRLGRRDRNAGVDQALEWAGLTAIRDNPARHLSGGERQCVALARAWLRRPKALLLDEPTANLDRAARERTGALLQELKRESIALLIASHDPYHFDSLVDNALQLADGRLSLLPAIPSTCAAAAADRRVTTMVHPEAHPNLRPSGPAAQQLPGAEASAVITAAPGDRFPVAAGTRRTPGAARAVCLSLTTLV
jgi:tungstate transport system ATP-binding protein